MSERYSSDYLIIGSGIAGLTAALRAAEHGTVMVITKRFIEDCNTYSAQGGIACVFDDEDSIESHVQDTLESGAGLCDETVVRSIISDGPKRLRELIDWGVEFSKRSDYADGSDRPDDYDLGKEGGHSYRRVLHTGDTTGKSVLESLKERCLEHSNISIHENRQAVDLIVSRNLDWDGPNRVLGAWVLDRESYATHTYLSKYVILASGGAGKVYLYSSNPDVACGEGIAMAYRAYAEIANMEFYQFHPTILHHPQIKSFLISEALRGEGAVLKSNQHGELVEFMKNYPELGNLATRDVVAQAIDQELKKTGQPCVYIDITHHDEAFLKKRFQSIFSTCLKHGINIAEDLIPVVPAAHYCCGGIRSELNGKTTIENLYAIGEVACTGLHGANRLASNSLLEGLVVANNAIEDSINKLDDIDNSHMDSQIVRDWSVGDAEDPDELVVISHNWDEIRRFMWDYVGIFKTNKRLQRAKTRIRNIRREIEHFYWDFTLTPDLVELRNMASVAEMIIDSALAREENIGLHFNVDNPEGSAETAKKETILRRPGY
ncbi:MAG: L-aspartate oxidase [Lentisphaeria bacterium]|nr:L-aspartate oxidase [Lentisphaeria bacterium]